MSKTETTIEIFFDEVQFGAQVDRFEKFFRIWGRILDAFCTLTGEKLDEVEVTDIESGKVTFTTSDKTIDALRSGFQEVVINYIKIVEIRNLEQKFKSLNLSINDEMEELIGAEIDSTISSTSASTASKLLETYGWDSRSDGAAIYSAVKTSLMQLLTFIERGGKVRIGSSDELLRVDLASVGEASNGNV